MDRNDELRAKLEEQEKRQAALACSKPNLLISTNVPMDGPIAQAPLSPEPDGWIAWHPDSGANLVSLNDISSDTAIMIHVDTEMGGEDYGFDDPDQSWLRAMEMGWRIRPVKIVFLDEGGGDE